MAEVRRFRCWIKIGASPFKVARCQIAIERFAEARRRWLNGGGGPFGTVMTDSRIRPALRGTRPFRPSTATRGNSRGRWGKALRRRAFASEHAENLSLLCHGTASGLFDWRETAVRPRPESPHPERPRPQAAEHRCAPSAAGQGAGVRKRRRRRGALRGKQPEGTPGEVGKAWRRANLIAKYCFITLLC